MLLLLRSFQVLIRIRPLSAAEKLSQGHGRCLRQESAQALVWLGHPETRFTFDHIGCETLSQVRLKHQCYFCSFCLGILVRNCNVKCLKICVVLVFGVAFSDTLSCQMEMVVLFLAPDFNDCGS